SVSFLLTPPPPSFSLFPYTTLFRSLPLPHVQSPRGWRCEAPALNEDFGGFRARLEAEGHGEPRDGPQAEGREPDEETEEHRRLDVRGESTEGPHRDDGRLRPDPSEEPAEGDEEEDPQGREGQGGRLELDPRQDRRRDERRGDRGSDRERQVLDSEGRGSRD